VQALQDIKAKYCPDGELCGIMFMLMMMIGFMFIAMRPIIAI
jgi:hypothetical protein